MITSIQWIFVSPNGEQTEGPLRVIDNTHPPPLQFDEDTWDEDRSASELHRLLREKDNRGIEATMRAMDRLDCWRPCLESLMRIPTPDPELCESLLWFWVVYGFHIATSIKGDSIFIDALRRFAPPYNGGRIKLYRGELQSRQVCGIYGFAWTPKLDVAEMFARRRFYGGEGSALVLQIDAHPEMIIYALPAHSEYLGEDEYLIDPRLVRGVVVLKTVP